MVGKRCRRAPGLRNVGLRDRTIMLTLPLRLFGRAALTAGFNRAVSCEDCNDLIIPKAERFALLRLTVVPLIYASGSGTRAAYMVQDGFSDLRTHAQPLEASRERPAKVMKRPGCNRVSAILLN